MARLIVIILLVVNLAATEAFAADAAQGARFAKRVCAACHAVAPGLKSSDVHAPAFAMIARSRAFRTGGAAFVLERHPRMPLFALTGEDAENVTAYIGTLRKR